MEEGTVIYCAGCGAEVTEFRKGQWGSVIPEDRLPEGTRQGHNFCCRSKLDRKDDVTFLVSADYHYVKGETQRYFRREDLGYE